MDWAQIREELNDAWSKRNYARFYALATDEAKPIIRRGLRATLLFSALRDLELDDAFDDALGVLVAIQADQSRAAGILQPGNYLWTMTKNTAVDELRRRNREQEAILHWGGAILISRPDASGRPAGEDDDDLSLDSEAVASALLESLLPEATTKPALATRAVRLAIRQLSPKRRGVIEHLLLHGPAVDAADAARELGMSATNYRSAKSRAFDDLRAAIPLLLAGLGDDIAPGPSDEPPEA